MCVVLLLCLKSLLAPLWEMQQVWQGAGAALQTATGLPVARGRPACSPLTHSGMRGAGAVSAEARGSLCAVQGRGAVVGQGEVHMHLPPLPLHDLGRGRGGL